MGLFRRNEDTGFEILFILLIGLILFILLMLLLGNLNNKCAEGFECTESPCGCCVQNPFGEIVPNCGADVCGEGRTLINNQCCLLSDPSSCLEPNDVCVLAKSCETDSDCVFEQKIGCTATCEADEFGNKECKPCADSPCDPSIPDACCTGYFCDDDSSTCSSCEEVACTTDADCCSDYSCSIDPATGRGSCKAEQPSPACLSNDDCPAGQVCDPLTGTCKELKCEGNPCDTAGQPCQVCDAEGNCNECTDNTVCANAGGALECKSQGACPSGYFEDLTCPSGCRDAVDGTCMEVACEGLPCTNPGELCVSCEGDSCFSCTDNTVCSDDFVCTSITQSCPAGTEPCSDIIAGCNCCETSTLTDYSSCASNEAECPDTSEYCAKWDINTVKAACKAGELPDCNYPDFSSFFGLNPSTLLYTSYFSTNMTECPGGSFSLGPSPLTCYTYYLPLDAIPEPVEQVPFSTCASGYADASGTCCSIDKAEKTSNGWKFEIACGTSFYQTQSKNKPMLTEVPATKTLTINCAESLDKENLANLIVPSPSPADRASKTQTQYMCADGRCINDPSVYDLNLDSILNEQDISILRNYINSGGTYRIEYDFNRDGVVNSNDESCIENACGGGCRIISELKESAQRCIDLSTGPFSEYEIFGISDPSGISSNSVLYKNESGNFVLQSDINCDSSSCICTNYKCAGNYLKNESITIEKSNGGYKVTDKFGNTNVETSSLPLFDFSKFRCSTCTESGNSIEIIDYQGNSETRPVYEVIEDEDSEYKYIACVKNSCLPRMYGVGSDNLLIFALNKSRLNEFLDYVDIYNIEQLTLFADAKTTPTPPVITAWNDYFDVISDNPSLIEDIGSNTYRFYIGEAEDILGGGVRTIQTAKNADNYDFYYATADELCTLISSPQ